jgi:hypothetical protein
MTISKHKLAYLGKMNKKITHDLLNVKNRKRKFIRAIQRRLRYIITMQALVVIILAEYIAILTIKIPVIFDEACTYISNARSQTFFKTYMGQLYNRLNNIQLILSI